MNVLLVDAFDSFVYIVDQYLRAQGCATQVVRSNALSTNDVCRADPDLLLLGPGPGHPRESGHVELLQRFATERPVFGICLGHQALALAFGGSVGRATPLHGKSSAVRHDGAGAFAGLPQPLTVTRYHSLVVTDVPVDGSLVVTAVTDDGQVMGLRHRELPAESVQFHPESICTDRGADLLRNVVDRAASWRNKRHGRPGPVAA